MADIKLTKAQQAVVDDRGGALLVSAAAGSGKTKVLVDRLLKRICDSDDPCNIDQFLVITYTKAAAAELRVKIAQAINERLSNEPENRHLQRQLHRIYLAQISTVHAFCSDLLRTYAHVLDIPGDFRVVEETESQALQAKVLDQMLEQGYAGEDEDFLAMVQGFCYGRDDRRLPETILLTHKQMRCRANVDAWLEDMQKTLDTDSYDDVSQTPWGSYLLTHFRDFLQKQLEAMERAYEEMQLYPNIFKGLGAVFEENMGQLRLLLACSTWDDVVANRQSTFGRAGAVRNPEDVLIKERIANVRAVCWKSLQKWQDLFTDGSETVLDDIAQTAKGAKALLRFVKAYDDAYGQEKIRRKIMDFSDLEHLAIKLLVDKYTGQSTSVAKEIAKRYVEIMVDEYQDSNEVQDSIFGAVSQQGKNRFMVGDVKQSIYRFRLAEPELFLRKYHTYPLSEQAEPGEPRKILLSENFRSRGEILSACNDVFGLVMRQSVGDLDYTDAEALKQGRAFPALSDPAVELHCLTCSQTDMDKTELEAEYVAERIRTMLDEKVQVSHGDELRPVEPGDVVILMRSLASTAETYLQALARRGIPAVCERGGSLLDTSEVQILLAILQVIDNPHQDIPLLTALASPVFGFTPDMLAKPRTTERKGDYYDSICERPEFSTVLNLFAELREQSRWLNLHELIDCIFVKTGMLAVFSSMEDGLRRERNLLAFRSVAVSFEATGSKALPQFLWYLSQLQECGGKLPIPQMAAENVVRIMTTHSSKGLEFPVVFLCDLSRSFNLRDMQDAVLVDNEMAVACNRVDNERYVRYPTVAKKAIIHKKTREAVSEELRVLYVAMTRAKDRLVMTYYSKYLLSELKSINTMLTNPISDDLCESVRNPGKWILMSALCRTEAGELFAQVGNNQVSRVWDTVWKISFRDLTASQSPGDICENTQQAVEISPDWKHLAYEYPNLSACYVPGKLTATQLKGRMQDQEAADGAKDLPNRHAYSFRQLNFLPQTMTAAQRGTATHLFMQFARFDRCVSLDGLQEELRRMQEEEFLTAEQVDAVPTEQILRLFTSELGQWILSREVVREFKFSILVDAVDYGLDASGEQVMLQGVVDCFAVEDDGITIIDFKTDKTPKEETYRSQLEAYGAALSRIYQKPVKAKILYFFTTGEVITL